ncbi:MAG TPA: phosphoribosylanthranilate isomerase [Polyangiaceae bacterium]|nr:phosphoribosylanthranilate isomerase [Polyangiaceae bacterium]
MVHFKICGITSLEDADLSIAAGASAIGLNLVPSSPRFIDVGLAKRLTQHVGTRALVVLVVADLSFQEMLALRQATGAKCLQLHGGESNDVLAGLLPHAYKAVRVGSPADVESARRFSGEHLLVDAKVPGKLGGTGHTVDFSLVAPLARGRKLTLAGGLHPGNVADAIAKVRPFCVDVASGVEVEGTPRRKDKAKLRAFGAAVRAQKMLEPAS